jgi:hypothetical protein
MHRKVLLKVGAFFMSEVNEATARSDVARAKSILANEHKRSRQAPNDAAIAKAKANLAAAKLEKYVAEVLASAPELSASQKAAIGALLQGATS